MAAASAMSTVKLASIPDAFSKAKSLPTSRCSRSRKLIWSSTSRPPRPSASPSRKRCWLPQTRSFNETQGVHRWARECGRWPRFACAQERAVPVVGYLSSRTADVDRYLVDTFHQGLNEGGFVEG